MSFCSGWLPHELRNDAVGDLPSVWQSNCAPAMPRCLSILFVWTTCGLLFDVLLLILWPPYNGSGQLLYRATYPWRDQGPSPPSPAGQAPALVKTSTDHAALLMGTGVLQLADRSPDPSEQTTVTPPETKHQLTSSHTAWSAPNGLGTENRVASGKGPHHFQVLKKRAEFFELILDLCKDPKGKSKRPAILHGVKTFHHDLSIYLLAGIQPSYTCAIHDRFGKLGDGGKVMCRPAADALLSAPDCLVYSYGSRLECSFERDVRRRHPGCDVHVFDPSPSVVSEYGRSKCAAITHYHNYGLGGYMLEKKIENETVPLKTLQRARAQLGHADRRLAVLKVDVEGDEFDAFQEMYDSDVLRAVGMVLLEVHLHPLLGTCQERAERFMHLFSCMNRLGFVVYHKELNWLWGRANAEFSFVRKSLLPEFSQPEA